MALNLERRKNVELCLNDWFRWTSCSSLRRSNFDHCAIYEKVWGSPFNCQDCAVNGLKSPEDFDPGTGIFDLAIRFRGEALYNMRSRSGRARNRLKACLEIGINDILIWPGEKFAVLHLIINRSLDRPDARILRSNRAQSRQKCLLFSDKSLAFRKERNDRL